MISLAVQLNASDIHIVPTKSKTTINYRVDNRLIPVQQVSNPQAEKLIAHFKFRAKMDIGEKRRPQNGSLNIDIKNQNVNLRLSTLPTPIHESLAIRVLPQSQVLSLKKLPLYPTQIDQLRNIFNKNQGLVIISGATGSGKSTTIYASLYECIIKGKRVVTLEDPIEKKLDGAIQVEINERIGLTYEEGLKSILRHDPDIIMIGEIRDVETAKVAVRAAMTGHLVISTIHANDAYGSIIRFKEFGISTMDICDTLVGAISQKLVEVKCPFCGSNCHPYCRMFRKNRRLAVFEILIGETLFELVKQDNKKKYVSYINQLLLKAVALGYVDSCEAKRWGDY